MQNRILSDDLRGNIVILYNVVTIDGPVGVGKSSVAKEVASRLGYTHIDTGAMYRAVTLAAMKNKIPFSDQSALTRTADESRIELIYNKGELTVLLNGEDVTTEIRDPEVSRNTSPVADTEGVRKKLVSLQREMGLKAPSVLEGRDISTVVFPDAFWKFYLDASVEERVLRRLRQLRNAGKEVEFENIREGILQRDLRDRSRDYGPLRAAPDAFIIDTTTLNREEVVNLILSFVKTAQNYSTFPEKG